MNYEDNTKDVVLNIITQGQPIAAGIVTMKAESKCGIVLFADDVANIVVGKDSNLCAA